MKNQLNYLDHHSSENIFVYPRNTEMKHNLRDHHIVTLEEGEDGMIIAKCAEINVITQGKSMDDTEKNVVGAVSLMREELGKDKEFSISLRRVL